MFISNGSKSMQGENSREWWKIKVYNEVSEFLKHLSNARKLQLQTALIEYEQMFNCLSSAETGKHSEMELSMNDC